MKPIRRRDALLVIGAAPLAVSLDVLAVGALASLTPRVAHASELDDVLAKIAQARASLKTMVGPFTQTRKIGLLASEVRSTGTLMLVRPDRLRWELAAPDDVVYWVTPEGLAYKSKSGQGRVPSGGAGKVAAALNDLRVLLSGDLGLLRARYDMKLVTNDPSGVAFEAVPKAATRPSAPPMQRIDFALAPDLVRPTRATLVETARDRTDIAFGALERDVAVDPAKMRPPA
jgi:hypothetical protein